MTGPARLAGLTQLGVMPSPGDVVGYLLASRRSRLPGGTCRARSRPAGGTYLSSKRCDSLPPRLGAEKANRMGTAAPRTNHWRNWLPILTTYAYIALVVWIALAFFRWREGRLPWWTDIPVGLVAVALIGPAQHRLLILGQEAALGVLFRNRWLNELAGDWLIHFPFSTATHHVRQQILAHYQYPNDPDRDAELVIPCRAGFWPLNWTRLLRLSAIIRWMSLRTNYNFERNPSNPFFDPARPPSKMALHIGTAYVLLTFAVLLGLYFFRRQLGDDVVEAVLTY